jgi:hypothetical protein
MTDRPDAPMNDAPDERDPGIAALLDVEPLDDVTRARLVRNAVAAADAQPVPAHHRRVTRWIAAAAASVVVVVGVGVALTVGGPDDSQPTASRPAAKAPGDELRDTAQQQLDRGATPESPAAAPSANEFGERATDAVPALGDLGEVADPAALRRAVRRATASGTFAPACSLAVNPTRDRVVSAGTGTVDGEPATVFIVERAGGGRRAVAIVNAGCTARKSVTL